MSVHTSDSKVSGARRLIKRAVEDALEYADLTEWETVSVLTGVFHDLLADSSEVGLWAERQGSSVEGLR